MVSLLYYYTILLQKCCEYAKTTATGLIFSTMKKNSAKSSRITQQYAKETLLCANKPTYINLMYSYSPPKRLEKLTTQLLRLTPKSPI